MRLTSPKTKLTQISIKTYAISKLKTATNVKRQPVTLKPFRTLRSLTTDLMSSKTPRRFAAFAKSKAKLAMLKFSPSFQLTDIVGLEFYSI